MIVLRMTAVTIAVLLLVGCGGGGSSRTAPLMDSTIGETQDSTTVDTGTDSVSTGELRTIWAGAPLPSSADELAPVSVAYDQVLSYGAWSNVQAGAFGGFLQYVPADLSRASDLPSVGRAVYDGRHASYVQRGGVHSAVSGDASISILFGTGFNSDDMFVTVQLWDGTRSRFDRDVFLTLHNTNPVRVAPTFAVAVDALVLNLQHPTAGGTGLEGVFLGRNAGEIGLVYDVGRFDGSAYRGAVAADRTN